MTENLKLAPSKQEIIDYKAKVVKAKKDAEVVTLREWYDTTPNHSKEIVAYMEQVKQLGPLGKELHKRGMPRVTERYGDTIKTLVEATYQRGLLDLVAPLCALSYLSNKLTNK